MAPTFQPVITASTWSNAWADTAAAAARKRGTAKASDGVVTPKLTNGDVTTLVDAWLGATSERDFGLWYQFAANAYGWNPQGADKLDTGTAQRESDADVEVAHDLFVITGRLAADLDTKQKPTVRLDARDGAFNDPIFQGRVRNALLSDGAKATLKRSASTKGKIPVGCKGGIGLECREGWELERVKGTLLYVCRNKKTGEVENPKLKCKDPVLVDDPITGAEKSLTRMVVGLLLILGVAYVVRDELRNS